jgi:hypothetical protein
MLFARSIVCSALFVVCAVALGQAPPLPNPSPPPPAGVAPENWQPLTPSLGFVVTKPVSPSSTRATRDPKTGKQVIARVPDPDAVVTGYFVILWQGHWVRVELEIPPARPFNT